MRIFTVLIFVTMLSLSAYSQHDTSLGGIILDGKGNVVDATVTIASVKDSGVTFSTKSDNVGEYRFSGFPEGSYLLQASSIVSGKERVSKKVEVKIVAGQSQQIDLVL